MSLWLNEPDDAYHATTGSAPAYMDADQSRRWHRLKACRMLYEGKHCQYFLREGRTQYPFRPVKAQDRIVLLYVTQNLCKLVSNTTADILLGAKPRMEAPTKEQNDRLNDLARKSLVHPRLRQAAIQASWAGGAFLASVVWNERPYLMTIAPDEMYPVGSLNPDGQYEAYVRFATANIGTGDNPIYVLLETTYEPGVIRRELHRLNESGKRVEKLELNRWPEFKKATPQEQEVTGLDRCTITYVPNFVDEKLEVTDFDGLQGLQDSVNAKRSQKARVLVLHADPKVWFDTEHSGPEGKVDAGHNAIYGGAKPEYITWESQLEAADVDLSSSIMAFCTAAEMSPVGLGLATGGAVESARKRRLDMTKDIAKAGAKALYFEPVVAMAIETTELYFLAAAGRAGNRVSYAVDPIGVHMQDGLPVDPSERAEEASIWRSAGLLSVKAGVAMRVEDPAAAAMEVVEIEKEKAANMPTVLSPLGGEEQRPEVRDQTSGEEVAA